MQTSAIDPRVPAVFHEAVQVLKPPAKTTVSQWAERERILSSESSASAGRYRTALAPYRPGMMDAVNIPGRPGGHALAGKYGGPRLLS